MNNKIFITGCAGFIGFHLADRMLRDGYEVTGLDNMNSYYDVTLKESRLELLNKYTNFKFYKGSLENWDIINPIFQRNIFEAVINLAAQAGVRYSITNPRAYIDSNIVGFMNILEACRQNRVGHLIFASSSSVYGANTKVPFSIHDNVDHPVSLYAATKKSNELMAHAYSHLYGIPCTGLRFFTVYGPWGRPDMACFLFTKAILEGRPIKIFNYGNMTRDFTYVDDIVEGIVRLIPKRPVPDGKWDGDCPDPAASFAPYKLYNIGNNRPVELLRMIEILEEKLGKKAEREYLPMQAGDVLKTYADIDDLMQAVGFRPRTAIEDGLDKFIRWYREYYRT